MVKFVVRTFFSFHLLQEARERDPVPDRERFCVGHSSWDCSLHPGEERPQQADDW